MKTTRWLSASVLLLVILSLTLLSSCATVFSSAYDVSAMTVEKKDNGCLVELSIRKPIKDISALISRDNWLVITLVGATVDFDRLRSWEPDDLVSEVEVIGFRTSVQLTLKLRQSFRSCEVVHPTDSNKIDISLFAH
jgi:hypothetical protein